MRALLLLGVSLGAPAIIGPARAEETAVAQLHRLFDQAWERDLAENPLLASQLGDRRYNDRWPDLSVEAIERSHVQDQALLAALAQIDFAALPPVDALNYELFRREYRDRVDAHRYRRFLVPLDQRGGLQTADQVTEQLLFERIEDYQDWLARLASFHRYAEQTIALMRRGIAERRVHPRIIMQRVPAQIDAQLVEDPAASPFFVPFERFPEAIPAAERTRLAAAARERITDVVLPAYRQFRRFFVEEYLPACRESVGIWDSPDGAAYYPNRIAHFTTTALSAEEIHRLGRDEVARIRADMQRIIDGLGFEGDFAAFLEHLRTDPRFYYADPQALYQAYLATSKRIDPELVRLFGRLPRVPYGVRPIPEAIAPDTTTAYYSPPAADGSRAGYYYVNLYRPEVRPKYEIEVLTVHEAVPGHHLQIALAQELGELPAFRRYLGFTAFVEGWGLYSESLGGDLGLYRDPYSKFGQLTYEMWRAVRLVVDTGIHARRWSRERAIEFFAANAAKTEHDVVNEIDRYIAWPGQALAYKIGELKIKQLRHQAERRLGEGFDLRGFHDTVLSQGAVPLDILEAQVERWIVAQEPTAGEAP